MSVEAADLTPPGYSLLVQGVGLLELPSTAVLALTGEDRKGWLQGQITQDLRDLRPGGRLSTCFCSPTGQLQALAEVFEAPDALYLVTDQPQIIRQRVQDLVILEEVELQTVAEGIVSYQGPGATRLLADSFELPTTDILDAEGLLLLRNDRTGAGGWDAVPRQITVLPAADPVPADAVLLCSLEAGFPVLGIDTTEKTLPPELGRAFTDRTVSLRKGCYTGQEVLQRIGSRGHTNKTWMGLLCDGPVNPGDPVFWREETVGTVTRAGISPRYGAIAAATLKNKAAIDGLLVTIGGVSAEVVPMPILTYD